MKEQALLCKKIMPAPDLCRRLLLILVHRFRRAPTVVVGIKHGTLCVPLVLLGWIH
jgi:hypothetical protein